MVQYSEKLKKSSIEEEIVELKDSTKIKRKDILLKIILKLKALLPKEEADKLYVGGSYALATFGLKSFEEVHDLDLRIDFPSTDTKKIFRRIEEIDPSFDSSFVNRRKAGAQFILDGISIDIFYMDKEYNKVTICEKNKNGRLDFIKLAVIPDIVNEKKRLKRPKDILSLLELSSLFITQEETKEMISNLTKKEV